MMGREDAAMKGEVVYLYAFDVANEIVTARVGEVLSTKPFPFTIRGGRAQPRYAPLYRPLAVEPPPPSSPLGGRTVRLLVRVYEVGVVTVAMRAAFEAGGLLELLPLHRPVLEDGRPLDRVARELCAEVCRDLRDAMVRASSAPEPEAYTAFCLTELEGVEDVNDWLRAERRAVAGLLTETDPARLSEVQVGEELRVQRSYEKTDLTVVGWDAALVVDLGGYVEDVLYVLELANLQLEEFRAMDQTLDRYLARAYDDLQRGRPRLFGPPGGVLGRLRWLRIDLTRLADEVTHITKFVGDWRLARVYLGASERFYLEQWRASVDRRLAELDRLYSAVHSEVNERRMFWLEVIVVVLIAIDLLALLLRR
jgi:hypothetical protein